MLRVLFLCTGNRCRSPFAEACLSSLTQGASVEVDSAGLLDLGGVGSTEPAIQVARSLGLDLSEHVSKSLYDVDVPAFDVIIGFERKHVAGAVVDGGAAHEQAFVLPELVRLLGGNPPAGDLEDRARSALRRAHEARGTQFVPGEEIADPIGRPLDTYERVFEEIRQQVGHVAQALLGDDVGTSAREVS
jgi:low molecular weight protein-tyrosine phosphatase